MFKTSIDAKRRPYSLTSPQNHNTPITGQPKQIITGCEGSIKLDFDISIVQLYISFLNYYYCNKN